MNKAQLVNKISKSTHIPKSEVESVLNAALATIRKAVTLGDDVTLSGFGTFLRVERKARPGRNPRTGQDIEIPAAPVPKFRPGKEFRESVFKS